MEKPGLDQAAVALVVWLSAILGVTELHRFSEYAALSAELARMVHRDQPVAERAAEPVPGDF